MAGYSQTPLLKKLGIKPDNKILIVGEPASLWDQLGLLPEGIVIKKKPGKDPLDFIHFFVKEKKTLEKEVLNLRKSLQPNGMIWISWPKKASKVETDITEDVIRNFALKNGLVDVKVCAVDDVWSGLKLVIPVKERLK